MEAVRDDKQSLPKAGRTGLPQGRLSEVSGRLTVACLFTAAGGYPQRRRSLLPGFTLLAIRATKR
jgi:hypothetical protein